MNGQIRAVLFVLTLCVGVCSAADKPRWKISGQLEEACTCNAPCPCWFNSLPTKMTCGGSQVLFIEKGQYGKVRLNGLAVAHMGKSPEGKTMMESFGNWDFSYLYIDEKADAKQREALEAIGKTVLPFASSTRTQIRYIPITRTIEGREHKITFGSHGAFHGSLVEGGLGGPSKIRNPPGADPLHQEYLQGRTSKLAYTDAGQSWDQKDSNYMFATFTVDSEQYKKFAAGLAQKMGGMNQPK